MTRFSRTYLYFVSFSSRIFHVFEGISIIACCPFFASFSLSFVSPDDPDSSGFFRLFSLLWHNVTDGFYVVVIPVVMSPFPPSPNWMLNPTPISFFDIANFHFSVVVLIESGQSGDRKPRKPTEGIKVSSLKIIFNSFKWIFSLKALDKLIGAFCRLLLGLGMTDYWNRRSQLRLKVAWRKQHLSANWIFIILEIPKLITEIPEISEIHQFYLVPGFFEKQYNHIFSLIQFIHSIHEKHNREEKWNRQ